MNQELRATLEIGPEIGRGHFGRVHLGRDAIRERLAIKVINQIPNESAVDWNARRESLLEEGCNLQRANHQYIVPVYYLCESNHSNAVLLVMEYCEGGSLEQRYRAGPISPDEVHKIATEVCLGLTALHERGMIHRDIKPGNILIDAAGSAKIGDFGFVTNDIVEGYAAGAGYLDHLAPEYWHERLTSTSTDIWALGMTLYRLLHGHSWYTRGVEPKEVIAEGRFADTLRWLPHISREWKRLIRAMLADSPEGRPRGTHGVLDALARMPTPTHWHCTVEDDIVRWTRTHRKRRIEVELIRHSQRLYSWRAVSLPTREGKTRTLAESRRIGSTQADRELREFFR